MFGGVYVSLLHMRMYLQRSLSTFASYEDSPFVEFMYLVFTRMPGETELP